MIVIAFYVVPFITSWGRLLPEGGSIGGTEVGLAIMEFYFVFCFVFVVLLLCEFLLLVLLYSF